MTQIQDLFRGDATGLDIPAHPEALIAAGPAWLTRAMHRFGTLAPDNAVTALTAQPCPGGSTGKKLFLTLEYARPEPHLDRVVFAKFSRDFDDKRRDWQKTEMESEARLVALSREPGFPIRVPRGFFADYEATTGTGLCITECIDYGRNGIEDHRRKCLDWQTLTDPLPYYHATVTALARLAGAHKAGRLGPGINAAFPFDPVAGSADPIRYARERLDVDLDRCRRFARECPQLLPAEIREDAFFDDLQAGARLVFDHEAAIREALIADADYIALNHWNSHIDNAWFWHEGSQLQCGLIDWGRVGQITLGSALWGGLSAAHHDIWNHHLDDLLGLFVQEYAAAGGPRLTRDGLKRHLALHMAAMGVARVLIFPEVIRFRAPDCDKASGLYDPMFTPVAMDPARNCLSIYTVFCQHWRRADMTGLVRELVQGA